MIPCDGQRDCDDGSDEFRCRRTQILFVEQFRFGRKILFAACLSSEYMCPGTIGTIEGPRCIEKLSICDGVVDCPNGGADEFNCSTCNKITNPQDYMKNNKK